MESAGLTRRRNQLELLARACERGEPAQIRSRSAGAAPAAGNAALLALEDDGLLLYWPETGAAEPTSIGAELDISFSLAGRGFRFRSPSHGRVERRLTARGTVSALKVGLPLRIDPAQWRRTPRFVLPPGALPAAALTPVVDREQRLAVRIIEVSMHQVRAVASSTLRDLLICGTHHWLAIPLPDGRTPVELIVRLAHVGDSNPSPPQCSLNLAASLCAGDDGARIVDALERIESYLARTGGRAEVETPAEAELEGTRC